MCTKMPQDKQEMLAVTGVGENKYHKYGQSFIDAIAEFIRANPKSVISTKN